MCRRYRKERRVPSGRGDGRPIVSSYLSVILPHVPESAGGEAVRPAVPAGRVLRTTGVSGGARGSGG